MSSFTRARVGERVTWKDSAGHIVDGICLHFRSDHMIAGTQSATRPYVWVYDHKLERDKRVPNNVLWIVPYVSVIATSVAA